MRRGVSPAAIRRRDRLDWSYYYQCRYEKTRHPHAEQLAIWYLLLYEAFGPGDPV